MEKIEKMKASKKFRNVDLNPIKDTAIVLVRYASKRDNLGVKFGKTEKKALSLEYNWSKFMEYLSSINRYKLKDSIKNRNYNIDY